MSDPQSIREHFEALHGLDAAARAAYLDGLADRALAAQLATLIGTTDSRAERIVERAVKRWRADIDAPPVVPGYRIERLLGSGGMGRVFVALREALGQRVALKVLYTSGHAAAPELEHERAALARLNHPQIATFIDSGVLEDSSVAWFAMALIDAEPLGSWLKRELKLDARLELIEKLLLPLKHAHERGVVHGDLKASNVLVDRDGTPHLLDFGISSLLGERLSPRGATAHSASPEQLRAEPLSAASDVYSAGRLLVESIDSAVDRSRASRDLERIAARACAPEPNQRYADAGELLDDLSAERRALPLPRLGSAPLTRARKWIARYPALALGAVALVALALTTLNYIQRLERERAQALAAEQAAEQSLKFMIESFYAVVPQRAQGREVSALDVLKEAETRLLETELQPAARGRLSEALGRTFDALGDYERASRWLNVAIDQADALPPDRVMIAQRVLIDVEFRRGAVAAVALDRAMADALAYAERAGQLGSAAHASLLSQISSAIIQFGRFDEAAKLAQQALDIHDANGRPDIEGYLSARHNLAVALRATGQWETARAMLEATWRERVDALGADRPASILTLQQLASTEMSMGRLSDARRRATEVLERRLRIMGPNHFMTIIARNRLASIEVASEQPELAEALLAIEPRSPPRTFEAFDSQLNIGIIAWLRGDPRTALNHFDEAYAIYREVLRAEGRGALSNPLLWRLRCARELEDRSLAESLIREIEGLPQDSNRPRRDRQLALERALLAHDWMAVEGALAEIDRYDRFADGERLRSAAFAVREAARQRVATPGVCRRLKVHLDAQSEPLPTTRGLWTEHCAGSGA
jgi:eukaryotic-like serine/threonine-protein kinase